MIKSLNCKELNSISNDIACDLTIEYLVVMWFSLYRKLNEDRDIINNQLNDNTYITTCQ